MQNIHCNFTHNKYLPWHSQEHLIFDFQNFRLWYEKFLAFVGESICQGETPLFVSRLTMHLWSWVKVLVHPALRLPH